MSNMKICSVFTCCREVGKG